MFIFANGQITKAHAVFGAAVCSDADAVVFICAHAEYGLLSAGRKQKNHGKEHQSQAFLHSFHHQIIRPIHLTPSLRSFFSSVCLLVKLE
jgi:hypothetical protein